MDFDDFLIFFDDIKEPAHFGGIRISWFLRMKQPKSGADLTSNGPFSKPTSNCGDHHGTHTSVLCVWERLGTIPGSLGSSGLIKTNLSRQAWIIFFYCKKMISPPQKMSWLFKQGRGGGCGPVDQWEVLYGSIIVWSRIPELQHYNTNATGQERVLPTQAIAH